MNKSLAKRIDTANDYIRLAQEIRHQGDQERREARRGPATVKLRNAHEPFDKVLVLSTAHVPNNNPDWGENYAVPVDFGWVRWAGEPVDWTPDWLMPSGTFQASAGLKSKATSKRSPRPSRGGTPSSWEEARDIVNLAVMNMAYEAYLGLVTRLPEQKK